MKEKNKMVKSHAVIREALPGGQERDANGKHKQQQPDPLRAFLYPVPCIIHKSDVK